MANDIDPLTVDWWHDLQPFGWGCDCGASEMERHSETCAVTPLYAQICSDVRGTIANITQPIIDALWLEPTTLIKCAVCGRKRIGRDMLVIYEAPLYNSAGGSHLYDYKYPHNVVKAVCPEHNRNTKTVAYQGVAPSGY